MMSVAVRGRLWDCVMTWGSSPPSSFNTTGRAPAPGTVATRSSCSSLSPFKREKEKLHHAEEILAPFLSDHAAGRQPDHRRALADGLGRALASGDACGNGGGEPGDHRQQDQSGRGPVDQ